MWLFTDRSTLQVTTRLRHIVDLKKRAGWVQDGQKKKPALAKEMFFPVGAFGHPTPVHPNMVVGTDLMCPWRLSETYVCMYVRMGSIASVVRPSNILYDLTNSKTQSF